MAYSDITSAMSAATTAFAAGDYVTARDKAMIAQGWLAITPDTQRQIAGGGTQALTWNGLKISEFVSTVQKLLNASVGIQASKVVICGVGRQHTRCDC